MVIVVNGDNKNELIEKIMEIEQTSQEDLQALIERAMNMSVMDTESNFSESQMSTHRQENKELTRAVE